MPPKENLVLQEIFPETSEIPESDLAVDSIRGAAKGVFLNDRSDRLSDNARRFFGQRIDYWRQADETDSPIGDPSRESAEWFRRFPNILDNYKGAIQHIESMDSGDLSDEKIASHLKGSIPPEFLCAIKELYAPVEASAHPVIRKATDPDEGFRYLAEESRLGESTPCLALPELMGWLREMSIAHPIMQTLEDTSPGFKNASTPLSDDALYQKYYDRLPKGPSARPCTDFQILKSHLHQLTTHMVESTSNGHMDPRTLPLFFGLIRSHLDMMHAIPAQQVNALEQLTDFKAIQELDEPEARRAERVMQSFSMAVTSLAFLRRNKQWVG